MTEYPRDITVGYDNGPDKLPTHLQIGEYRLDAQHIAADPAPVAVKIPGTDVWTLWVPIRVEGTISDPHGEIRVVHEGDIDPFSSARPGPCGNQPPMPEGWNPPLCSLDAGHAGCHKDEQQGTVWRELA